MEEDQDELLHSSEDESLSGSEDQCIPNNKPEENNRHILIYFDHSITEFVATKVILILSTTMIIILLPLYMETINVAGDVYSLILTNTTFSTIIFTVSVAIAKLCFPKFKNIKILKLPLRLLNLLQLSFLYIISAFMIMYALDQKRVVCHLQDPMKGLVLIWSLLYYFFFCKKFMGLQRIFSVTTIIVGIFIAVDYGLCDEFKCRGFERLHISDDSGQWNWQIHSIWTSIYIGGLALFAAYFTLFERNLSVVNGMPQENGNATTLLTTVSSSVSNSTVDSFTLPRSTDVESPLISKKFITIHMAMWLHIFSLILVIAFCWTDFIPTVGKGSNSYSFFNYTINGLLCHFELPSSEKTNCNNVPAYSWLFLFSYIVFVVTSIKFLIMAQSAVYTVATMTAALPLTGIWWSLFHMTPIQNGLLVWAPSISGELICSILGLPIIIIGLYLLCKSHFKDYRWSRVTTNLSSSSHIS